MNPELRQILVEVGLAVVSAVGVALLAVLKMAVARLADLAHVKLADSERAQLEKALADGVAYAEEWARKALTNGGEAPGQEKLFVALNTVREVATRAASAYTDAQLQKLIEAHLARSRGSLAPTLLPPPVLATLDGQVPVTPDVPELPPLRHPFG